MFTLFMQEYIKIGRFVATHGLNGDLILVHSLGSNKKVKDIEVLFIEDAPNSFIPYFIEKITTKNATDLIVKLEGFNTKEAARKAFPKDVWLKSEDFRAFVGKTAPIGLLGYKMIENNSELGEIIEVIEQPHQVLCTIIYKGKEALIPLHEESLKSIDHKKKTVDVSLPDGLLEIYL
jgi:16S rRNA processing protein RimM